MLPFLSYLLSLSLWEMKKLLPSKVLLVSLSLLNNKSVPGGPRVSDVALITHARRPCCVTSKIKERDPLPRLLCHGSLYTFFFKLEEKLFFSIFTFFFFWSLLTLGVFLYWFDLSEFRFLWFPWAVLINNQTIVFLSSLDLLFHLLHDQIKRSQPNAPVPLNIYTILHILGLNYLSLRSCLLRS